MLQRRSTTGIEECLTPEGFSIRTRVHEYGGRCFVLGNGCVFFCNDNDQRIYRQALSASAEPVALTPEPARQCSDRFADLQITPDGFWLIAVMERFVPSLPHPESALVAIQCNGVNAPRSLVTGSDFYANPVLSDDGRQLAWLRWQHPFMPWDENETCLAALESTESSITLGVAQVIAGGTDQSVCQLGFLADGSLLYARDVEGGANTPEDFWNLYSFRDGEETTLTRDQKEYGAPHWVFGAQRHANLNNNVLLTVRSDGNGDELVRVDTTSGDVSLLPGQEAYNQFADLTAAEDGSVLLIASGAARETAILKARVDRIEVLRPAVMSLLEHDDISLAQPITFPTHDGDTAHGYFYAPRNRRFTAPDKTLPPLLVMVHGGPTARTTPGLDLARQYWTTRGFAVLDVNHRGSTGYGRRYRQSLLGAWGVIDAADVAAGAEFLVKQKMVAAGKICIRGGSAGGYVVLRVLTEYPDLFAAGACYYGIGNLVTLAQTTHKFELKYTDRLVGEEFDPQHARQSDSRYYQRSPINFMSRLRCPMIVFQGTEDKVVPPALAQEIVSALKQQNVKYEYVEYPGEGHGFRRSETNIDARQRETAFFLSVLRLGAD